MKSGGWQVGVVRSDTDQEGNIVVSTTEDVIKFAQGELHRLVGSAEQGVIAEIWQHIDANHPSDEEDIVRVQDDFGRLF